MRLVGNLKHRVPYSIQDFSYEIDNWEIESHSTFTALRAVMSLTIDLPARLFKFDSTGFSLLFLQKEQFSCVRKRPAGEELKPLTHTLELESNDLLKTVGSLLRVIRCEDCLRKVCELCSRSDAVDYESWRSLVKLGAWFNHGKGPKFFISFFTLHGTGGPDGGFARAEDIDLEDDEMKAQKALQAINRLLNAERKQREAEERKLVKKREDVKVDSEPINSKKENLPQKSSTEQKRSQNHAESRKHERKVERKNDHYKAEAEKRNEQEQNVIKAPEKQKIVSLREALDTERAQNSEDPPKKKQNDSQQVKPVGEMSKEHEKNVSFGFHETVGPNEGNQDQVRAKNVDLDDDVMKAQRALQNVQRALEAERKQREKEEDKLTKKRDSEVVKSGSEPEKSKKENLSRKKSTEQEGSQNHGDSRKQEENVIKAHEKQKIDTEKTQNREDPSKKGQNDSVQVVAEEHEQDASEDDAPEDEIMASSDSEESEKSDESDGDDYQGKVAIHKLLGAEKMVLRNRNKAPSPKRRKLEAGVEEKENSENIEEVSELHKEARDKDIFEKTIDVSDFDPEELNISLSDRKVSIEAEHVTEKEQEALSRSFRFSFDVPNGFDISGLKSTITPERVLVFEAPKASQNFTKIIPLIVKRQEANDGK
ncbi:unnamed protein product [Caenorhabditis auriculariae]|uniref:SHSP domain-containing protein n=1 Tax=Caenorhabditis auriculariae TaxID=2777116 RepID=A0A8S1H8I0_9PELO|nr:unnamed protein product [Caenorhabditis auriculariae]